MSISFKLRSHLKNNSFEEGQLLKDHLENVTKIALETNELHGIKGLDDVIRIICMTHDFGKASNYFQDYLRGKEYSKYKNHGEISAYLAYYLLPEEWKLIGYMCVRKHHGNLEPGIEMFSCDEKDIVEIAKSIEINKDEVERIYNCDLTDFFQKIKTESFLNEPRSLYRKVKSKGMDLSSILYLQYLWSLLLTADKTQLIRGTSYQNYTNLNEKQVKNYKEQIRNQFLTNNPLVKNTRLFQIKNLIYDEVISNISKLDLDKDHFLSINVPTGTGKTLAVFGASFHLAERLIEKGIKPSIIYCLPYTSIIDQNHAVLTDLLEFNDIEPTSDYLLKQHYLTEISYFNSQENKEYLNYDARFCVENWQSTIITTTFIQLFNTIYKTGINDIGHRFHKLAGSIIILDEIQEIPPKYHKVIEATFKILGEQFNTYFITVTATKPLFLIGKELVTSNKQYFTELNRIKIENYSDKCISLSEFSSIVKEDIIKNPNKSFLIVLNTIKSALEVYNSLADLDREVIYLSTEILPIVRLQLIKYIREHKDNKFVLVSTQLIEAGVDIDFDIVYRDFAPIASINQTAGRANRNSLRDMGVVKLFRICRDNGKEYSNIYPNELIDITKKILNNKNCIYENELYAINNEYFNLVNERKSDDESNDILANLTRLNFKYARELFKLIEPELYKEDIIVDYDEKVMEAISTIKNKNASYLDIYNSWIRLNNYKVSVPKDDLSKIQYDVVMDGVKLVSRVYYDEKTGIRRL